MPAAEIDRLRTRMERELARESHESLDVKTGHGGLVDVEFATQYLQLVHGGRLAAVRTPNTLEALEALQIQGALGGGDAEALHQGYLFLRRVETRLRLVHGEALSRLPITGRPTGAARASARRARSGGRARRSSRSTAPAPGRVREVYARVLRAGA